MAAGKDEAELSPSDPREVHRTVRFHGRGGQGAVSAAALLSLAAFEDGFEAQAFPKFGSERRGAPVESYVRMCDRPIRSHTQVYEPDAVVVLDPSLFRSEPVLAGLREGGTVVVNAPEVPAVQTRDGVLWVAVPASQISVERLGRVLPNTVLLAALAATTGWVRLAALEVVVSRFLARKGEDVVAANIAMLHDGYEYGVGNPSEDEP